MNGLRDALGVHFLLTIDFFSAAWKDAIDGVPFAIRRAPDCAW
jgi:hypothetical protein